MLARPDMTVKMVVPVPGSLLDFRVAAGSFDHYEGSFDWNTGSADRAVSFRLNGLFRDHGSYREGKGGRTAAINPSLTWRFDDTGSLNVNFEYAALDFTPDSGDIGPWDFYVTVDDEAAGLSLTLECGEDNNEGSVGAAQCVVVQ